MAFHIDVITTKRDDPDYVTHSTTINYDNSRSRAWLAKHSNWALRNGLAVHTAIADTARERLTIRDLITPSIPDYGKIVGPCTMGQSGSTVTLQFTSERLALDFFNRHHVQAARP